MDNDTLAKKYIGHHYASLTSFERLQTVLRLYPDGSEAYNLANFKPKRGDQEVSDEELDQWAYDFMRGFERLDDNIEKYPTLEAFRNIKQSVERKLKKRRY